jgi:hypothetical protein
MIIPPPKDPHANQTWLDENDVLRVWDGIEWVPYEDLPFFDTGPTYRDI